MDYLHSLQLLLVLFQLACVTIDLWRKRLSTVTVVALVCLAIFITITLAMPIIPAFQQTDEWSKQLLRTA
jgi:hypothetical protein